MKLLRFKSKERFANSLVFFSVTNSYLLTFPVDKAEILAVCLSKLN